VFGCVLLRLCIGYQPLWSPCRATRILRICLVLRAIGAADGGSAGRRNWCHLCLESSTHEQTGMVVWRSCATISLISLSTGAFPGILNSQPPVCGTVVLRNVLLLGSVSCLVCVCVYAGCGWAWLCDCSSSYYILNFYHILNPILYSISLFLSLFLSRSLSRYFFLSVSLSLSLPNRLSPSRLICHSLPSYFSPSRYVLVSLASRFVNVSPLVLTLSLCLSLLHYFSPSLALAPALALSFSRSRCGFLALSLSLPLPLPCAHRDGTEWSDALERT